MLKRLKRRFILINMALVSVAVAVMFGAVCVLTYRSGRAQIDRAVSSALFADVRGGALPDERPREEEGAAPSGTEPAGNPSAEDPPARDDRGDVRLPKIGGNEKISYVYTATVIVRSDGSYVREDFFGADIEDAVLEQAVEKAIAAKRNRGTVRSLHLAWERVAVPEGTKIVFASTDHLVATMRTTAIISGAVSLGSLLLFFGVSYLLAGLAIQPTAEAWEKQKQFVADASHDLKTPLTVILANADILRSQPDSAVSEQMQWVEGTAEEAERMRKMVNQLLELAKSEDMRESVALEPMSVSDLAERAALQFEPVAFERGITIESEIAPNVIIPCHEDSAVRLFQSLIDNAVKYSPDGETVTVRLEPHGSGAVFSVRNYGTPIPPEDLPHLFERFYRADKARSVGGFGLGLSIAKNLAERLRGKISVTSSAEGGTVFSVRF